MGGAVNPGRERAITVPVSRPHLFGDEAEIVGAALAEGWISSRGPYVDRFEATFAELTGVRHAVAVTNGTCALQLALDVLGVGRGDEVIVPDFTMIAPVFAVLHLGAVPLPVDADATWNLDPAAVEACITPRTRAILAVHTYGHPARVDVLSEIARRHHLVLVEDAAEALGATLRGQSVGSFGDAACFSLYANKTITTGEGGVVVTNDDATATRLRYKRDMCFGDDEESRFVHRDLGYNYRMSSLQAAFGLGQLAHFREAVESKRAIARRYDALLGDVVGLELPPASAPDVGQACWVYGVVAGDDLGVSRERLQRRLREEGIETRRFFAPVHRQPVYRELLSRWSEPRRDGFPRSIRLAERGLYLPSFVGMPAELTEYVAERVRHVVRAERRS